METHADHVSIADNIYIDKTTLLNNECHVPKDQAELGLIVHVVFMPYV